MKYLAPLREGVGKGPHRSLCTNVRGVEALDLCFWKGGWGFLPRTQLSLKEIGLKGSFGKP